MAFRGIRYATTPAGKNRFVRPQPVAPEAGITDARSWPASAPQWAVPGYDQPFYAWYSAIQPVSEDCLFLNVFAPAEPGKGRPVMVWLHGGGWGSFASSAPGTDATRLAAMQDVVVVSVNHRLNVFGFMAGRESSDAAEETCGAAGLLDLVCALEWVRDNVVAFGGDAGNVTILGQSGGAAKVAALLALPAAKGLFHKAIVQSLSGGLRLMGEEQASRAARDLAVALGMARSDPRRLREISMPALIEAARRVAEPFRPVVGAAGARHPGAPGALVPSADVPLMVGTTATEATWYYPLSPGIFEADLPGARTVVARVLAVEPALADHLVEVYRAAHRGGQPVDIVTALASDHLFKRNTFRFADLKAEQGRAPVYAYVFAHESPAGNGRLRSPHSAEVPFVFGTTAVAEAFCGTGPHVEPMTRMTMATWAAFARTGNPATSHVPIWPAYRVPERQAMLLDLESRLVADPMAFGRDALAAVPMYEYGSGGRSFALRAPSQAIG